MRNLLFVHVPKNAGTSIEKHCNMRYSGHHSWNIYKENFPYEWSNYSSFAIIRDPIDRFISCYRYAKMEKSYWHSSIKNDSSIHGKHPDYLITKLLDINSFIEIIYLYRINLMHPGWFPQYRWISDGKSIMVDKIIQYENLNSELKMIGISNLPNLNITRGSDDIYISEDNIKIIKELYIKDYEIIDKLKLTV